MVSVGPWAGGCCCTGVTDWQANLRPVGSTKPFSISVVKPDWFGPGNRDAPGWIYKLKEELDIVTGSDWKQMDSLRGLDICGQATKGVWGMSWH